jgi:hypothetical protein
VLNPEFHAALLIFPAVAAILTLREIETAAVIVRGSIE